MASDASVDTHYAELTESSIKGFVEAVDEWWFERAEVWLRIAFGCGLAEESQADDP